MRQPLFVTLLAVVAATTACYPEKRVVWSPDGRCAAVIGDDGLYLCGPDGALSARLAENVKSAAWLPDSERLVLVRNESVKTWAEMKPFLGDDRRERLVARIEQVRAQVLSHEGDFKNWEPAGLDDLTDGEKIALFLCFRDERGADLRAKVGEEWTSLEKLEGEAWSLQVARRTGGNLTFGTVLARSPNELREARPASDGAAILFIETDKQNKPGEGRLNVVPTDGTRPPREVADLVSRGPDWSADGRCVVYANTKRGAGEGDELRLGALLRRKVRGEAGQLLEDLPAAESLAGLVFQPEVAIRCLKDGRILFAALEVSLPCTTGDLPQRATLFALDPDRSPTVARLLPRQAEWEAADGVYFFEVSPDEKHVAIPGTKGDVSLVTLATGKVWTAVEKAPDDKLRMFPSWRSAEELCCVVPPPAGSQRARVALVRLDWSGSQSTSTVLSDDWPDAAVQKLLLPDQSQSGGDR